MESITRETILRFFEAASALMAKQKDYLIELDAALGDGDLGLTMTTGFAKANEAVHGSEEQDIGKLSMLAGMAIAKAVPSTMGTLVGSGFMKSAKASKESTELDLAAFATYMDQFVAGLMERGKAAPGDRTIIDSLHPAANALKAAAEAGKSIADALDDAIAAANEGVEATKSMRGKFGRSVFYGDQVLGKPDQGAVVGSYIMEAWKTAVL